LLDELNLLVSYQENPPTSLGSEWFIENTFPLIGNSSSKNEALLATFVEHFDKQISCISDQNPFKDVLVTGGGAKNKFFIERLSEMTKTEIIIPDEKIIDFKEALVFALMGILKLKNEINVLSSVTGAKKNHSSGIIYS